MALLFIGEASQISQVETNSPAQPASENSGQPLPEEPALPERICQSRSQEGAQHIAGDIATSPITNQDSLAGTFFTLNTQDAMALSLAFTQEVFVDCADHLVISETVDINQLTLAARLAAFRGGPLLVNAGLPPVQNGPVAEGVDSGGVGPVAEGVDPDGAGPVAEGVDPDGVAPAGPVAEGVDLNGAGPVPEGVDLNGAGPVPEGVDLDGAGPVPEGVDPDGVASTTQPVSPIHPEVLAEFRRLDPKAVSVVGSIETAQAFLDLYLEAGVELPEVTLIPSGSTEYVAAAVDLVISGDASGSELAVDESTAQPDEETLNRLTLPRQAGPATPVRLREAILSNAGLETGSVSLSASEGELVVIDPIADPAVVDPASELARSTMGDGPIWLVAADQPVIAILAQPALAALGGDLLYVDPDDLRGSPQATLDVLNDPAELVGVSQSDSAEPAASLAPRRTWQLVGPMPDDVAWQLQVISTGEQLPGGGYLLFPGRRIVAMYGHINTNSLGVLGEQGPAEGVERARQIAQGYDADGLPVVTAFEIITTLASTDSQFDGSYSARTPIAELRPWVEKAAEEDMYVILDLQPGRTDFLTQAKEYEELLKLPHVGLALDPEWRLKPNQFHLRQVGTVDSSEVNQVVDWLANLVRDNSLPQKLLMVHQFSFQMITNREDIQAPPELAVMIHMDGQGQINTKFNTYAQITNGVLDNGWWWGWKNFYDEDIPGPPSSDQVLGVRPIPVVVTFQ